MDEELSSCSGVLSGVDNGGRPFLNRSLFFLSWLLILFLFLSRVACASSFRAFCAMACSRFSAWSLRSGGLERDP